MTNREKRQAILHVEGDSHNYNTLKAERLNFKLLFYMNLFFY